MAGKIRFHNPKTIARPPGYTHVVDTTAPSRTVYIAGQLGLDLDNKLVGAPGEFRAQCAKAFENLGFALASVGATFNDVVKINNYLVDMKDIGAFREVRDSFLNTKAPPASVIVMRRSGWATAGPDQTLQRSVRAEPRRKIRTLEKLVRRRH